MIDREYELALLTMREREQEARQARIIREARQGRAWYSRLLAALRGDGAPAEMPRQPMKKVLEVDGTLTCAETGLVHRPWRDPAR
jgi:hypothetical protein